MSTDPQTQTSTATTVDQLPCDQRIHRYRFLRPVMKFAIVGVINNSIGYGSFVVLSLAGMPALGAMTISYALGMAVSFSGNRKWTFGHQGKLSHALVRFLAVNAVGYGLNFLILTLLVVTWHLPQIPVQLAAVGLVAVVTFLLMRFWAFRDRTPALEDTEAR